MGPRALEQAQSCTFEGSWWLEGGGGATEGGGCGEEPASTACRHHFWPFIYRGRMLRQDGTFDTPRILDVQRQGQQIQATPGRPLKSHSKPQRRPSSCKPKPQTSSRQAKLKIWW